MKIRFYYCQRCGSTHITATTTTEWDQTTQQWVAAPPNLETGFCRVCEGPTQIREGLIMEKFGDN